MIRLAKVGVLAAVGTLLAQLVMAAVPASTAGLAISGQVRGIVASRFTPPDTGGSLAYWGEGTTSLSRKTWLTGEQYSPGFIREGLCHGKLTLQTAGGMVTLTVVSPAPVPGFSDCPAMMLWTIKDGTGLYAHRGGRGCVRTEVAEMSPSVEGAKTFTMVFRTTRHGSCYTSSRPRSTTRSSSNRRRAASASASA
jgi:hypothetical protein